MLPNAYAIATNLHPTPSPSPVSQGILERIWDKLRNQLKGHIFPLGAYGN
jgi:hypothetical protein